MYKQKTYRLRGFLLGALALLFPGSILSVQAQILNVESLRIYSDSSHNLFGSSGLGFSGFNRYTAESKSEFFLGLNGNMNIGYFKEKFALYSINSFNLVLLGGTPLANTAYSHQRIHLLHKRKLSYEGFVQAQYDKARKMDSRYLVGGMARVRIYMTKTSRLFMGIGPMLEQENWVNPEAADTPISVLFLKGTGYMAFRTKIGESSSASAVCYYQAGYDKAIAGMRNRFVGDAALQFSITKKLRFQTGVTVGYDPLPIVPVNKFTLNYSNNFLLTF